jgi:hypothetical protein
MAIVDTSATETKKITAKDVVDGALNTQTANGVVYLNGSKEATAGSVVTYDGTTFKVDGAAVFNDSGADVDFRVEGDTDANLLFVDASTDRVGVGTNTPAVKFDIVGGGSEGQLCLSTNATDATTKEAKLVVRHYTNSEENFMVLYPFSTATDNEIYYGGGSTSQNAATKHVWSTAANNTTTSGTVRMTLDSSGNLGLGVTPSAWGTASGIRALQVGTYGSLSQSAGVDINLSNNAYYDGTNWKYIASQEASNLLVNRNTFAFRIAPSGNANDTITFTQAMTLDASGNLGVGATSPAARLDVSGGTGIRVNEDGAGTKVIQVRSNFAGVAPAINVASNDPLLLQTNNTERARITAGGAFLTGVTSGAAPGGISTFNQISSSADNNWALTVQSSSSTAPWGIAVNYPNATPNTSSFHFFYAIDATALRFLVRSDGGISNYQGNDSNLSDERVKTGIAPLGSMWDKFKAIEIVTFKYKDQTHDDDNIGVIAQQVESVAPEFVDVDGFGETPEDGVPLKTIYTTDMYHAAIKALQEAMTRIEALEAEVAALKGAN